MSSNLFFINTSAALRDAGHFANETLGLEHASPDPSDWPIRHVHSHWGPSGWGYSPQPVYCYGSHGSSSTQKKDHSWVAIPAAIIALGTLYFIGQNHSEWAQAKEEIAKLQQKNRIVKNELADANPALQSSVQRVFEKQMGLLERTRSDAIKGLFLKGILVTSVIAAGIGAAASGDIYFTAKTAATLEPLFKYGSITAFVASGAMLYRAGFSSKNETTLKRNARELQAAVHQASSVLNGLT